MKSKSKLPAWISAPLVVGALGALVWFEWRRPLRRRVESQLTRTARNLAVAAGAAAVIRFVERPVIQPLAQAVEDRRLGLLKTLRLPPWLEVPLAVALMDYTLYVWHYLTHKVPLLWRFHVAHHLDLDLDATTALRFHFGEMLLSVPWRAMQARLIGVSPRALSIWQTLLMISVMFHHSNVRLPVETERWLVRFVVTPRMHGIHHSIARDETNSNWSSGLTVWDWLHGTLRLDVPQDGIVIGAPEHRLANAATIGELFKLPFVK